MAVKGLWRASRPLDRVLVLLLLGLAVLGVGWSLQRAAGSTLVVERDGRVIYTAPLGEDARVVIPGPLGDTTIVIAAGAARVAAASCPQRLCMAMGPIRREGEVIACLPNRVLLRIEGAPRKHAYDLITE